MAITLENGKPYVGMPIKDVRFDVLKANGTDTWGEIRCGGPCRDDYHRIVEWSDGRVHYKLQQAALDSLLAAGKSLGFTIEVTGTWRSCEFQTEKYAEDPSRFAPPDKTAHTRGLAIDVSMNYGVWRRRRIRKALLYRGWHQARAKDEPWHYSLGLEV